MTYQYYYRKMDGFKVHSLSRNEFDSPNNPISSFEDNIWIIINSEIEPKHNSYFKKVEVTKILSEKIRLNCRVAFDNRGLKENILKRINSEEALIKFLDRSGLRDLDGSCEFLSVQKVIKGKYDILRAFKIGGLFKVVDSIKFNSCLEKGIGSRKSFGFGAIILDLNN